MPSPKRQHFVPVLHLKNFIGADPQGHVWTYNALTGNVRSSVPEQTGFEGHFYSIEGDDGAMDTKVEECLGTVETAAAPIYERLLYGDIPGKGTPDRENFAIFLALMLTRTPAMRRIIGEVLGRGMQTIAYAYGTNEKAFDGLLGRAEKDGARLLSTEERERLRQDFIDPSNYVMQIPKEHTLPIMMKTAVDLMPIISQLKWSLLEPQHGFFITTDNPVVKDCDPKTVSPIYGNGGFVNKTVEIIFPLSPHRLLFMCWNEAVPDAATVPRDYVDKVNMGLAANSDRYLFAHIQDKRLTKLAARFKDSRPGITLQGFGPKKYAKVEVPRRMKRN